LKIPRKETVFNRTGQLPLPSKTSPGGVKKKKNTKKKKKKQKKKEKTPRKQKKTRTTPRHEPTKNPWAAGYGLAV